MLPLSIANLASQLVSISMLLGLPSRILLAVESGKSNKTAKVRFTGQVLISLQARTFILSIDERNGESGRPVHVMLDRDVRGHLLYWTPGKSMVPARLVVIK